MATHKTEEQQEHPLTTLELEVGETVVLCRCFGSQNFPFCDGSHKQHPGKGPAIVKIQAVSSSETGV